VGSLDPGSWYSTYEYMALGQTTQRWLYAWEPGKTVPTPDVAAGMPQTSADGKTVTIEIRPGIRYSAPLAGRTVTAADVAYAITRDLAPRTGNGYARLYYANIVGARDVLAGRTRKPAGVEAPDATTLVIRLVRPTGAISSAQSLALPGTSPVPEDYARRYDRGSATTYGEHQVFTGPYVITSYRADARIELARNPDWNGRDTGDFRPAYLDSITFRAGQEVLAASHTILNRTRMVSGDFVLPPPHTLDTASPDQVVRQPAQSVRFIALNTSIRPFERGRAVNPLAQPSQVRILLPPLKKSGALSLRQLAVIGGQLGRRAGVVHFRPEGAEFPVPRLLRLVLCEATAIAAGRYPSASMRKPGMNPRRVHA
jgi:peptide/nickel transport system substrate-binding protein